MRTGFRISPFLVTKHTFCAAVALSAIAISGCSNPQVLIDPADEVDGAAVEIVVTEDNFEHRDVRLNEILQNSPKKTVIVDFTASWCGPCKMLAPELEKVARSHQEDVVIIKVDIDAERTVAAHYKVSPIPDIRFFQDGKAVHQLIGFHTAAQISERLP